MVKKLFAQLCFDTPGRTMNKKAPKKTPKGNYPHKANHNGAGDYHSPYLKNAGRSDVHRLADKLRNYNLGGVNNNKKKKAHCVA